MTVAPILDSIALIRALIVPALDALTTRPVGWWQVNQGTALPYAVVQSQDLGGVSTPRLGSLGWSGLITVKALASDLKAAEALLAAIAPGMASLVAPAGYDLSVRFVRPLALPPADGTWQIGGIWEVILERE